MADETPEAVNRVVQRLRGDRDLLRRGVTVLVDHAFEQPFSDLVSSVELVDWIWEGFKYPWPHEETDEVLRRLKAVFEEQDVRLRACVPEQLHADIESLLREAPPPPEWAASVVDGARVKLLIEPVIQSTLLRFAKRLPGAGLAGAGLASGGVADKLRKRVQKSAGKVGELGRIAALGLGAELDRRAGEFAKEVADSFRDEMRERLESEEGQKLAAEIRVEAFRRSLKLPAAQFLDEALKADPAWWEVAQRAVLGVDSASVRHQMVEIVQVAVGNRTLKQHSQGHAEATKALLVERLSQFAIPLIESPDFQDWLGELLA